MQEKIIPQLEEQRRDALVAYYLGQIIPSSATSAPLGITTPDDLYEYLLIDNQVSGEVETSRVAQGMASIQQYINAIYNGMEPGYPQGFDEERLMLWREGMSEYGVWAGYQMIEDYPENYIDPTLRLGKTSLFQTFEAELGQSRISEDSVQAALKNYLDSFEVVSNLQVVACYVDGEDFKHADYYFFGRQNVEPFSYYWRKAKIDLEQDSTQVIPAAWTEWKSIDVAFDAKVSHVRPVVVDGRLHIIWVEIGQPEVDDSGAKTGNYYYRAKMAYKKISDMWSPATLIYEGSTTKQSLDDLYEDGVFKGRFTLVASMDVRLSDEPLLVVCFQFRSASPAPIVAAERERFLLVFDKRFNELSLTNIQIDEFYGIAASMLGEDPARVQYPLAGKFLENRNEWILDSVTWDPVGDNHKPVGGVNQFLDLDVTLHTSGTSCALAVQGLCTAKRYRRSDFLLSMLISKRYQGCDYNFIVRGDMYGFTLMAEVRVGEGGLLDENGSIKHDDRLLKNVLYSDFKVFDDRYPHLRRATYQLDISHNDFADITIRDVQGGAGFKMSMFGDDLSFANMSNSFYEGTMPITHEFGIWRPAETPSGRGLTLNGAARTPLGQWSWNGDLVSTVLLFGALPKGDNDLGHNEFDIIRIRKPDPVPTIVSTADGGQFLDMTMLKLSSLSHIRLNTTFAKELVKRAERSLKSVLSWEAQHTPEPPVPETTERLPLDFKGANGRYFWELFFHVPHLVAHRLHAEFNYLGAENWLHYLFNPLERIAPLYPPPVADHPYWVSRPLTFADDPSYEWGRLGDPDAIAYGAPSHYRKAIFVFYLNNLIAHGDMLYRQLTRDTLTQAQLLYIRAASLLGPLSKGRSISQWTPMMLEDAAAYDDEVFARYEASGLKWLEHDIPSQVEGQPWLRLLDAPWFRLPVNVQLLDLWDRVALRLYNLRHNLTLDGKTMSLPLYAPAANPFDLLRAQAAGGGSGQRRLGSLAIIPPYRFRAMLPRVQNAVETLMRYGEQVRGYMELRDRAHQEELQQAHVLELSAFVETLQAQMIEQAVASREALVGSRVAIESRKVYYGKLLEEDVSAVEREAQNLLSMVKYREKAANIVMAAGNLADFVPTIFGTSFGGVRLAAPFLAAATGIQTDVTVKMRSAEQVLVSEQYRRRRVEWQFLARQSEEELEAIDLQIKAQDIAITAAKTSLEQAAKAQEQAQVYYSFLKNRAAGPALYQWLLSQLSTLYFQAYDVVLSMCLSTEACWQYEIGDRDTRFISTSAWADNRHGLTAGETLRLGLLQMESAFLSRHERRLELTKTISLKTLLKNYDPGAGSQDAVPLATGWDGVLEQLKSKGEIAFDLKSSLFDKDYPGHYLRQLVRVSVSIPAVIGPYEDVRIMLTQQTSSALLKPQIAGVRYLYQQAGELPQEEEDETIHPNDIVFNPRANQQIGISSGVDDHGLFMVDFGDERYFPFEGTGAVSRWTLSFPRHESERQVAILDSLTDIILHVRYLAVDGGKVFGEAVEKLVAAVEEGEASSKRAIPLL